MSIITNRDFWEKEILKDKKEIKQYLESGMINLKLLPPGKPLSLFIGGKYIKQNNMPNDSPSKALLLLFYIIHILLLSVLFAENQKL